MNPTRTSLDEILACMREFSDCVSEYELNKAGLTREDVQGMKGFLEVRYVFDRNELEQLRNDLPDIAVIDPDVVENNLTKRR